MRLTTYLVVAARSLAITASASGYFKKFFFQKLSNYSPGLGLGTASSPPERAQPSRSPRLSLILSGR